ncbi:MAG: diadenylate cyclase CdaA [Clostridia bacterium]|nr:diadenylate cyclase CdaA [Clostridia bacterium]
MNLIAEIWKQICDFFVKYVAEPIMHMGVRDVVDILILALVLYEIYRFSRNRRAGRVLVGLLFVVFLCILIQIFQLPALTYITGLFAAAVFFCIVVIFQPELRDALEHLGNLTFLKPGSDTLPRKHFALAKNVADEVTDAVFKMSETKTGALIVFEGITQLGDHMGSGKIVDARVTSHLLQNIFYDKAPLHDGALIIRNMRIWAASCVLPSTKGKLDFGAMGTRHRAAVGVTEVSDALALMVSEETGIVSVAQDGKLLRGVDHETLHDILMTYLAGRLYLRTKRGVHVNPFDRVPVMKKYDEVDEVEGLPGEQHGEEIAATTVQPNEDAHEEEAAVENDTEI